MARTKFAAEPDALQGNNKGVSSLTYFSSSSLLALFVSMLLINGPTIYYLINLHADRRESFGVRN